MAKATKAAKAIDPQSDLRLLESYQRNWAKFARDVLLVKLDKRQEEILESVRVNRRTVVRSGHARGKDFTAAVSSLCFLLLNYPSKVISTAPTGRQVYSIMMSELKKVYLKADAHMKRHGYAGFGAELQASRIRFPDPDWFLEGFKAGDKATEAWTGYHSPNILVVITEASGIPQESFDAIEGLLTGNSRLLLVGNPNRLVGEFYTAFNSPQYHKFVLSCMDAPNVQRKKTVIPGQVDWEWVDEHVHKAGWTTAIHPDEADPKEFGDFFWEGRWYRPSDLFRVKVQGDFPRQGEGTLIPISWIQTAFERWQECEGKGEGFKKLGIDVAGMGADSSLIAHRRDNVVEKLEAFSKLDHMETALRIKKRMDVEPCVAFVDTIGEGAGVYSRLAEQKLNVVPVKFSEDAKGLNDLTGEREFYNMRAYCYWALRDALDPNLGGNLALPPDELLMEELTTTQWEIRSNGKIIIEPKEDIRDRIGRSPDRADAIAHTYYPFSRRQAVVFTGLDVDPVQY